MAIPDYQSIMLPLLQLAADQQEHSLRETIDALADDFNLTSHKKAPTILAEAWSVCCWRV